MICIYLDKAYDRVPKDILKWELIEKGLPKAYVNIIKDMYKGANTRVKRLLMKLRFLRLELEYTKVQH